MGGGYTQRPIAELTGLAPKRHMHTVDMSDDLAPPTPPTCPPAVPGSSGKSDPPTKKDKKYKCKDCGKTFSRHPRLRDHIKTVHEGFVFKCETCGDDKTFASQGSLNEHMKRIHSGGYTFKCPERRCNWIGTNTASKLESHILSKHKKGNKVSTKNVSCAPVFVYGAP